MLAKVNNETRADLLKRMMKMEMRISFNYAMNY